MSSIYQYTRNGITYAEVRTCERVAGRKYPVSKPFYLGKVIDLEKGIFQNKKLGIFKYTIKSGIDKADVENHGLITIARKEKFILDFGSSFLLSEFAKSNFIWELFRNTLPKSQDTLMAMVFFYIEMASPNRDADKWFEGSFTKLLFPSAQLKSQRISDFLENLGQEEIVRVFFERYLANFIEVDKKNGILIDSTGLPNAIHFPLTAVSNHNGDINEEVRLIYVIDVKTGLPLYFRYNAGNIVDVSTLKSTIEELKKNGVSVRHAVVDAGYCSETNIKKMYAEKIHFLTRVPVRWKIYKDAFSKNKDEVLSSNNRYMYQDRVIGIKMICTKIGTHRAYLYLCVDYNRRNDQIRNYTKKAEDEKIDRNKWESETETFGFFGLLSSQKVDPDGLLPLYYTRQTVEQIFDISKNNLNILPLRTHKEETFRGHILLSFMVIVFL
jgi:hypothetical protein